MQSVAEDATFRNANDVSLKYLVSSALGLVLVTLVGLVMGLQMTSFGANFAAFFLNLRGLHLQTIIFAWLSMALMGAMLYTVPRIVGRDLYSKTLGNLQFYLTWLGIVLVAVTLLAGFSEGREYMEPIFIIDVAVVVVWLLFAFNIFMTIATSGAKSVPFSAKFISMAILFLGVNYLMGMVPLQGLTDAVAVWTFAHNQVNGWFMLGVMGLMYHWVPKITGLEDIPPYNQKLTHVHFWTLMVFIPPSVMHHLLYHQVPIAEFWKEMGQWTSVGMLVPTVIWTYIMYRYISNSKNGLTLPLKFLSTAMVFYFLNCVQGAVQSIRAINDITHGSQWTIGHAHLALVGWISFGVLGILYFLIPRLAQRKVFSEKISTTHLWLMVTGLLLMWIPLSIGGLVQGSALHSGEGYYAARDAIAAFLTLRAVGGAIYGIGAVLFAYNVYATLRNPQSIMVADRPLPVS